MSSSARTGGLCLDPRDCAACKWCGVDNPPKAVRRCTRLESNKHGMIHASARKALTRHDTRRTTYDGRDRSVATDETTDGGDRGLLRQRLASSSWCLTRCRQNGVDRSRVTWQPPHQCQIVSCPSTHPPRLPRLPVLHNSVAISLSVMAKVPPYFKRFRQAPP